MLTAALPNEAGDGPRMRPDGMDLRNRLRGATADAHRRLDAALGTLDLQSRAGYRRFLAANAAALLPLEQALVEAGVAESFPDWATRTRGGAILDDLARVGGVVRPLAAPAPLDAGAMLGMLYVLEGSRLGAAVLLKRVAQSPDPVVAGATRYLRHGAGQRLWPGFLSRLGRLALTPDQEARAIDGARCAFDLFAQAARMH